MIYIIWTIARYVSYLTAAILLWFTCTTTSFTCVTGVFLCAILTTHCILISKKALSPLFDSKMKSLTYPQVRLQDFFFIQNYLQLSENLNYSVISRPIYILLDNIVDKFVISWHSAITQQKSFPKLVRSELVSITHSLYQRLGYVNKYNLVQYIMDLYLVLVQETTSKSSFLFTQLQHYATQSIQAEEQYTRAVVDLLMKVGMTKEHFECEGIRSILREILSTQLLDKLINLISNPGFIYKCILLFMERLHADGSSLNDDDKNFLRNVHSQKKYYEVIVDDAVENESLELNFGTPEACYSPSNTFRIPKVRLFGHGISRFAVYVIEFPDKLWKTEEEILEEEEKQLLQLHFVGRRFKEFYALHDRLRRNKITKPLMSKINFPSKEPLASFPFNRLDKDFLSSRKDLFTQYLNELSKYPDIVKSDDLKEFLGYQCDELKEFRRKLTSFTDTKFARNLSRVFRKLTRPSAHETGDFNNLEDGPELYANYRESIRHTKKLVSISAEHRQYIRDPPESDISKILEKFISDNMTVETEQESVATPSPPKVTQSVSISASRYSQSLLNIMQKLFSSSGCVIGMHGFTMALSTIFWYPLNRYIINKINLLTSENYWFMYLTNLNQLLFEDAPPSHKGISKDEFIEKLNLMIPSRLSTVLDAEKAVWHFADSLSDQQRNKTIMFMVIDNFLSMYIPELSDALSFYKYQ